MGKKKVVQLQELLKRDRRALKVLISLGETVIARNRESGKMRTIPVRALYQNNPQFYRVTGGNYDYLVSEEPLRRVFEKLREIDEERHKSAGKGSAGAGDGAEADGERSPDSGEGAGGEASSRGAGGQDDRGPASGNQGAGDEASSRGAGDRGAGDRASGGGSSRARADGQGGTAEGGSRTGKPPKEGHLSPAMPPNFGEDHERILELPAAERVSLLAKGKERLKEIAANNDATAEELNEALVTSTTEAALVNKTTIQEALRLGNDEAKRYTEEMVNATQEMLRSTAILVDNDLYDEDLINEVVQRSNGTVVQHMTRVFLTGFAFMLYYNRQILTSSLANRIRIDFNKKYKKIYQRLLPHLHEDYLSLEHVFYGGIKALSDLEINRFATGFLVHDVGKVEDIEYHEGEAGYDRETVVRHVKLGYKAVMNKTTYPREAALITGYHHEYYGDPSGYGYFREFLQAYKNMKPDAKIDYLMSYEMEPLIDYEVMAYFPAKMLEVVDVFDSVTDPNRKYREPLSPAGAIEMIQTQFVDEKVKIDPIILDLFKRFLTERGILD